MAMVNGRPFLDYLLAQIRQAGITDVILCVGHRAEVIEKHIDDGQGHGVRVRYSRERELLGTAGALSLARALLRSDPFLAVNGDSYCEVDIHALLKQHQTRGAMATMVVTGVRERSRYGSAVLGSDDGIVRFVEKGAATGPGYINGGIYVLGQAVLDPAPVGRSCSLEQDIFPGLAGCGLYAFKTSGTFIDIGVPSELERAQAVLKEIAGGGVGT